MTRFIAASLVIAVAFGCSSHVGNMIQSTHSSTSLDRANFKVVKASARGVDRGFYLLGFLPIVSPSVADATDKLMDGIDSEGRSISLTNVTQERGTLYLILFSIPKVTLRADVIEFVE